MVGCFFINVDLAIFQPCLDLEAGDNQSLKIQVARRGIEPRSSCSASQELNHSATAAPVESGKDLKEGSEKENFINSKTGYNYSAVVLKQMLETQRRRLNLNVGGRMYQTSAKTLGVHENSILGKMTKFISPMMPYKTELGVPSYFLDRDPDTFKYKIEYLRFGKDCTKIWAMELYAPTLKREATFFQLDELQEDLNKFI